MRRPLLAVPLLLAAVLPVAARARTEPPSPRGPIPVILDTDIGDDIDDTWALALALKSPEIDLRLVVTDFGNTEQRAKLVAKTLELAGRTDVPIGIGMKENDDPGPQAEWVKEYDLARYPGRVLRDGVQAIIDAAMAATEPTTLIAIAPPRTSRPRSSASRGSRGSCASRGCTAASAPAMTAGRSRSRSGT
jgi:hypothetical protein